MSIGRIRFALVALLLVLPFSMGWARADVVKEAAKWSVSAISPEEELEAAKAAAYERQEADLAASAERLRTFLADVSKSVKEQTIAVKAAQSAFDRSRSLSDFTRLAQARSSLDQASLIEKEARTLAAEQASTDRKAILMVADRVVRPANLWFAYKKNRVSEDPCVVTYMGVFESVTNTQVSSLTALRESTWTSRQAGLETYRSGLAAPFAAVVSAEIEREKARIAFSQDPSAQNRAILKDKSGLLKIMQQDRKGAISQLKSGAQALRKPLTASAAGAMQDTDRTAQESMDLPKKRFAHCLDPENFPDPDA